MGKIVGPSQRKSDPSPGSALSPIARSLVAQSLRPNTRRAYAVQIAGWLRWRGLLHLEPCSPVDVANYLAVQFSAGKSPSTLRVCVSAIRAAHEAHGWQFNTVDPVISRVLRGATNATSVLPRQAEPLRGENLLDILESIADEKQKLSALRDAAVLSVGYVFALRRSEIVGLDLESQAAGDKKSCGVLRLRPKTIEVVLARSKTSNGMPEVVSVPRENNSETVRAIEGWVSAAGIKAGQPLFWSFTKGGNLKRRLSDQTISKIVRFRVAKRLLVPCAPVSGSFRGNPNRMSGHSLRVGLVVTAAEAGADLRAIAKVTRHRCLAMPARYAEQADQQRTSPHLLAGVGLEKTKEKK